MKKHDGFCGLCGKPCPAEYGTCYGCWKESCTCTLCGKTVPRGESLVGSLCAACDEDWSEQARPFLRTETVS